MKNDLKSHMSVCNELSFTPISEKIREKHLAEILDSVNSLKNLTLEQRKKEASKPIYLVRYE